MNDFRNLPATLQARSLEDMSSQQLDTLISGALAEDDRETLAILIPCRRNRYERGEKLYVILKCRDWWLEKNLELWVVHKQYDSFDEYVHDKSQERISTVRNYCAIWELYHRKLGWSIQEMALAGMKKLEVAKATARRQVERDGTLDPDLKSVLLDEDVSYRRTLDEYRNIKDGVLWPDKPRDEQESTFQFRIYSDEHIERHKRGIVEVTDYRHRPPIVMQIGRFVVNNPDVEHYVYMIAEKIKAEIL